jgi:hypothetical protein
MPTIDLAKLRIPLEAPPPEKRLRYPRSARGRFVRSIPLPWLLRAAQLPGRTLHVAIVLRYLAGCAKTPTVPLSTRTLLEFSVGRYAAYRGLLALERAGLVTVERRHGRLPRVTIVEVA